MKLLLALLIAYAASQVAYDRAYQQDTVLLYHSPSIEICIFQPVFTYGLTYSLRGYFEKGQCNIKTKPYN